MDPVTVGAVSGGAQSAFGVWNNERNIKFQRETNAHNAAMAREQMAFQERMSSTAHQRNTKDLEAAGLNRILSATQGGSSTPSGAMAMATAPESKLGDVMKDTATTARDVMTQNAALKNVDAQTLKTATDTVNAVETGKGIQLDNSAKQVALAQAAGMSQAKIDEAKANAISAMAAASSAPAEANLKKVTAEINTAYAGWDAIQNRALDLLGGISSGVGKLFRPDAGNKTIKSGSPAESKALRKAGRKGLPVIP